MFPNPGRDNMILPTEEVRMVFILWYRHRRGCRSLLQNFLEEIRVRYMFLKSRKVLTGDSSNVSHSTLFLEEAPC